MLRLASNDYVDGHEDDDEYRDSRGGHFHCRSLSKRKKLCVKVTRVTSS